MARRVPVPEHILHGDLLDRIDYGDAFAAPAPPEIVAGRTAEQLAGLAAEGIPSWLRLLIQGAHRWILGLRLTPSTPPAPIPGWQVLARRPDEYVFGVEGGLVTPRLVVSTTAGQVTVITVLRYDHPAARWVWLVVGVVHRAVARYLVDRGARRAAEVTPSR